MEKKGNKFVGLLLILVIACLSLGIVIAKPMIAAEKIEPDLSSLDTNDYFLDDLFLNNIAQYKHLKSIEAGKNITFSELFLENPSAETAEAFDSFILNYTKLYDVDNQDEFYQMLPNHMLLEFYAESKDTRSYTMDLSDLKVENTDKSKYFKWYLIMDYDANGKLTLRNASEELAKTVSSKFFKGSLMEASMFNFEPIVQNGVAKDSSKVNVLPIKNATFIYAITNEKYALLANNAIYSHYLTANNYAQQDIGIWIMLGSGLAVILVALFIATRHIRELSLFDLVLKCPFEILVCVLGFGIGILLSGTFFLLMHYGTADAVVRLLRNVSLEQAIMITNLVLFVCAFMYLYLISVAVYVIKSIFIIGIGDYFMNYTIIGACIRKLRAFFDIFKGLDLSDELNKKIAIALLLNLAVGSVACLFSVFGIAILIVYTVLTYLYIQRVVKHMQSQFKVLETVTKELSLGHLDVEVEEDLELFSHVKENLLGIKIGFKKAVEEEVRSSKMKTELISNVSHDLKTPLTTLISYIDLLQKENITDEERLHYIQILDNSSMRLKRCIDDLFEISKVESGSVQCNLVEVNLVDLLKQIHFEMSDKIEASQLVFKTAYPEHKLMCMLDSPKTYRIFDNLYMNIFKYAMPQTRVYVDLFEENGFAVVSFKNVSATEITYAADELTERFVRNDASRNSEGSGLGLAIAKSFTELQGGSIQVLVDGDLFKVVVKFELLKVEKEKYNEEQA